MVVVIGVSVDILPTNGSFVRVPTRSQVFVYSMCRKGSVSRDSWRMIRAHVGGRPRATATAAASCPATGVPDAPTGATAPAAATCTPAVLERSCSDGKAVAAAAPPTPSPPTLATLAAALPPQFGIPYCERRQDVIEEWVFNNMPKLQEAPWGWFVSVNDVRARGATLASWRSCFAWY